MRSTRLNLLSDRKVRHAPPGLTSDGGGLYIRNRNGNLTWIFRYTHDGKKREMGMGSHQDHGFTAIVFTDIRDYSQNLAKTALVPSSCVSPLGTGLITRTLRLRRERWSKGTPLGICHSGLPRASNLSSGQT